jgi:hypothetical protein
MPVLHNIRSRRWLSAPQIPELKIAPIGGSGRARAVMVLLSLHGLAAAQIAVLLGCHPVCADVQRDDGGVVGGEDVGAGKRPRRRVSGGALVFVVAAWWSV